ncbi:MAG: alkaline phosphatase family protein, partial [Akkermansiaceae bacterium]
MPFKKRLLLVGWDSADWKLIHPLLDQDKLPGVAQLVQGGVSGNLTTLEPQLSPMLWTSIATGKMAYHHGVYGFTEVNPISGRIVPVSAATRKCKTIWEMLGERGLKSHVVGWFATQGEQDLNGCMVSNMYGHLKGSQPDQDPADWEKPMPGTYWPEDLAGKLDDFRVSPHEIDPNKVLRLFVPEAPHIDQNRDRRLWPLLEKLAEAWSVHSAATWLMEMEPEWDFFTVYYRALDEIKHLFMHYHPPRMDGISQRDFELFQHVVTATYRAHDMMLQRLIALAGEDTAVVLISDHGFHSDHLRPKFTPRVPAGITVWHRPQGVFAASGPGFAKDELVHGARLLDVTPTILHYFGLPVGADMEGRVLVEAFEEKCPVAFVPTWENPDGPRQQRSSLSEADSKTLLDQFVALGYIDEVSENPDEAAAETNRENKWNLARACLYAGKDEMALPLLEDCFAAFPERTDYAQTLARCQLRLGLSAEADESLEVALESFGRNESAHLLRAHIAIDREDFAGALKQLSIVRQHRPEEPDLLVPLCRTYLSLRRWEDAEKTAQQILAADPGNADAFLCLARLALHRDDAEAAITAALDAIGLRFGDPEGHFLLGAALAQKGDWPEAKIALQKTLTLQPLHLRAHRYMGSVLRAMGQPTTAADHEQRVRLLRFQAKQESTDRTTRLRADIALRAAAREAHRVLSRQESASTEIDSRAEEPLDLVLVSGLPRSGTSLMMQMLRAGGMDLMTDGAREADEDNPAGYWEWDKIRTLQKNPRILRQAKGKAVKVISALLPHLPPRHRYKIIFMRRPETEVVRSQWKMLERRGKDPKSEAAHLAETQANHVRQILARLASSARVDVLQVDYPSLVAAPAPWIEKLTSFLSDEIL